MGAVTQGGALVILTWKAWEGFMRKWHLHRDLRLGAAPRGPGEGAAGNKRAKLRRGSHRPFPRGARGTPKRNTS